MGIAGYFFAPLVGLLVRRSPIGAVVRLAMEIALRWLPIMVSLGRISFRVVRFAGMRLRQRRDLDTAGLAAHAVVAAPVAGAHVHHDPFDAAAGRVGIGRKNITS